MSRAKTKRPGTRSGGRRAESVGPTESFYRPQRKPATSIPDDLADAAEAALDDLIMTAESAVSDREAPEIVSQEDVDGVHDDDVEVPIELPRKKPPAPPGAKRAKPIARAASQARAVSEADVHRKPTRMPSAPSVGAPIDEGQLVDEHVLDEVAALRFAVYETVDHLGTAQGAIVAAGHIVDAGGAGQSGLAKVLAAIKDTDIDAIVVALPGGEAIIDAALALEPRRPVVIASISGRATDGVRRAIAAGADLALARPHDVERCAPILLAAARLHAERRLAQNARGAEAVLRAKLDELSDPEPRGLQPIETFQRVLELELKRARRFEYALSVAIFAVEVPPPSPPAGIRGILRARAGNALIHTIRDIDIATQLDHERFLVLLPYTDLSGAANLGRRVIAAVAELDPVVSGGRTFVPRVVGAVAGASAPAASGGKDQLSFAKLIKDATRALEAARRDGAELAVQP